MELPSGVREGVGVSLALLAATAALSGCGGGSSSAGASVASTVAASTAATTTARTSPAKASKSPARTLTRAQLAASAATICRRADAELAIVKAKNASVAEIVRVVPKHAAAERKAAIELSRLVPPPEIARDWALIVAYRSSLASQLAQLAEAAKANDTARIRALSASKISAHGKLLKAAKRAGLSVCGQV